MTTPEPAPGCPPPKDSFRARAVDAFTALLGAPNTSPVQGGTIYRWTLPRAQRHAVNVFVTIDAPELPNFAHVMVSDPSSQAGEPVRSFLVRGDDDLAHVLAYIKAVVAVKK